MSDSRLTKQLLFGQILISRSIGKPLKRQTQRQPEEMQRPLLFLGKQGIGVKEMGADPASHLYKGF